MVDIPISVGDLFQGGRVQTVDANIGQTYLRYSSELTVDTYVFSFPSAAGSALTFGIPRCIFVDNAENNHNLTIVVSGTLQTFPVPANSSGFYNIDAQQSSSISITSDGASGAGNPVEFIFYNYDRTPFVWYKFGITNVTVNIPDGADVALGETTDAAITNSALAGTLIAFTKGIVSLLSAGISAVFKGPPTLATNQVTVNTTVGGTLIAASRASRSSITITNLGTTAVYIGNTGLTTTNGAFLPGIVGASITLDTTAAVYGIVAAGSQALSFVETY
jgi:hypothetical protein